MLWTWGEQWSLKHIYAGMVLCFVFYFVSRAGNEFCSLTCWVQGRSRKGCSGKGPIGTVNEEISAAHLPGTLAHDQGKVQILSKWPSGSFGPNKVTLTELHNQRSYMSPRGLKEPVVNCTCGIFTLHNISPACFAHNHNMGSPANSSSYLCAP